MSEAGPDEVVEQKPVEGPALQHPDADIERAYRDRVALFTAYLRTGGHVPFERYLKLPMKDMQALGEAAAVVQGERAGLLADAILAALAHASERASQPDPLEAAATRALAEAGGVRP